MTFRYLILLLISLPLFSCSNKEGKGVNSNRESTKIKWKTITSEIGKFKIDFPNLPDIPIEESKTVQILEGENIDVYGFDMNVQKYDHPNKAYSFSYADQFNDSEENDIQLIFDGDRDGLVSSLNATVEHESHIEYLGHKGRYLYLTIDESALKMSYKVYYINGRMYKMLVVTREGNLFNKSINRFLNSFEYLE